MSSVFYVLPFIFRTYSRWTSPLPSYPWSLKIFLSLPGSRLTIFLSRCKFGNPTARQPMFEFYLLAFPRFSLRKKNKKLTLARIELTTSALEDVQVAYYTTWATTVTDKIVFSPALFSLWEIECLTKKHLMSFFDMGLVKMCVARVV